MTTIPADKFSACFAFTVGVEGGFTDDPNDPGNWTGRNVGCGELRGTKYGISAAIYPTLDIVNLTQDAAESIYRRDYWAPLQGDALPLPVAMVGFDTAVNAGVKRSIILLQQAAGQAQDGVLGAETMAALNAGDPMVLAREALVRRLNYYVSLPSWPTFGLGWARRIIALAGAISA
jgi:lysozyme family protein